MRMARGEGRKESDLLSYLLFDGSFASTLIDLGYSDAAAQADQLAALFTLDRGVSGATDAAASGVA